MKQKPEGRTPKRYDKRLTCIHEIVLFPGCHLISQLYLQNLIKVIVAEYRIYFHLLRIEDCSPFTCIHYSNCNVKLTCYELMQLVPV